MVVTGFYMRPGHSPEVFILCLRSLFLSENCWFPLEDEIFMGLYDSGKVGFFTSKKEGFGLLIESQELYQLMRSFYQLIWNDSVPAKEGEG